jgi:hypothetical protein
MWVRIRVATHDQLGIATRTRESILALYVGAEVEILEPLDETSGVAPLAHIHVDHLLDTIA